MMAGDRASVRNYVRRAQEVREQEFRSAKRRIRNIGEHPDNVRNEVLRDLILEGAHAALELCGVPDNGVAKDVPRIVSEMVRKLAAAREER